MVGFSLIQVSLILTVGALVMVSLLPGEDAGDYNRKVLDNVRKLEQVEEAMKGFMAAHGRRPCPADGDYDVDTANFGKEAANPGTCTGGTPAAPLGPDAGTNRVVAGTIPTKTLGLPDDHAFDEFGRYFTYAVDKQATSASQCIDIAAPGVVIKDGTGAVKDNVLYAYVSHGPDGHGAFPAQGSTVAGRFNSGSTDAETLDNASADGSFGTAFDNTFVWKEKTTTFDDLLYYSKYLMATCCVGPACLPPQGFRIDGSNANRKVGHSITTGDINGDGIQDVITSGPGPDDYAGNLYVVFGTNSYLPSPIPVSSLDGTNGFVLTAEAAIMTAPYANLAAGDYNGDGLDDILWQKAGGGPTFTYLVFGHTGAWNAAPVAVTTLLDGTQGVRLDKSGNDDWPGLPAAGDLNGDGIDDIVTGWQFDTGNGYAEAGAVVVLFGQNGSWPATIDLDDAADIDGDKGFRLEGEGRTSDHRDSFGYALTIANVNGDAYDDLIVGAPHYVNGSDASGYVIFGRAAPVGNAIAEWPAVSVVSDYTNGTDGFRLAGQVCGASCYTSWMGQGVAAPDLNEDGLADPVFVGTGNDPYNYAHLVFGRAGGWPSPISYATLTGTGSDGFRILLDLPSPMDTIGAASGDLDGDGSADFVYGSPNYSSNKGRAYVVYGTTTAWGATFDSTTVDGTTGFVVNGESNNDYAGFSVAIGNVVTEAGGNELLIGGYGADYGGSSSGSAWGLYKPESGAWPAAINLGSME